MASFLLAAVWARALVRWGRGLPVSLWPLVPLMVLWANVHVFFVVGIAWLWAATAWSALEERAGRRPVGRGWRPLAAASVAVTVAPLANPWGWQLIAHVVEISRHPVAIAAIVEFSSPDFHGPGAFALPFLLALVAGSALARERPDGFLLTLALGHLAAGLYVQRNLPLLAVVGAPIVARAFSVAFDARAAALPLPRRHAVAHLGLAVAFVVLAASALPTQAALEPNLAPREFPVAAARFLRGQPPLGRMLNGFNWGGYLIHALWPDYQVSMDGRTTVYGEAETLAYLDLHFARPGWRGQLARWRPDFVVWEREGALAVALGDDPGWAAVYRDDVAVVLVRADHPHRAALEAAAR
jgi:hypothetical protein